MLKNFFKKTAAIMLACIILNIIPYLSTQNPTTDSYTTSTYNILTDIDESK